MSFLHPWLLLGALAALIPLAIHLFDRRRPRPHPFAAIGFVLRSQKRTASRLKLRRLLLYLLRTLLLLAIPVALARPMLRKKDAGAAKSEGPAATALVLDTSLAMRFKNGPALFEKAREDARDALRSLPAEDPALVLVCQKGAVADAPGFDRGRLRNQLDAAKAGYGIAPLNTCLTSAAKALEESPLAGKRIEVFSAFTQPVLQLALPPPTVAGPKGERVRPTFVLHDAAMGLAALPNRAITDLKIEPAPQVGPRSYQFTFTVHNYAHQAVKDLEASLVIGGRVVAKGFLDLPAEGAAQKTLTHRFDAGGPVSGEIRLTEDGLAEDDVRAFAVAVPRELKALVLDGDPNPVRIRDGAFFLEAALEAPGSPVRETVRDVSSGLHEDFHAYDVIILLDVPAPSAADAKKLADFVDQGGGLLVAMGPQVDPEQYDQRFGALLPRPLRLVKTAAVPNEPNADQKAARLSQVATEDPIFQPFTGRAREGLFSARFNRYMLLEAGQQGDKGAAQVLATYDDGAPAVAIARRGKGRVLLFTSSLDLSWTDLPIRTSYLPLVQRFAGYLAGALEEHHEVTAHVGDSVTLHPSAGQKPVAVRAPSGKDVTIDHAPDGTLKVGPLPEPGHYAVLAEGGQPLAPLDFVTTLDPAASDTTRLQPEELTAYFGEEAVHGPAEAAAHKVPFWTWLLVAAAVAFFLEGTLLKRP